jgi:hypothetical protein
MELSREQKGRLYRRSADTVTYGRTILGRIVALNIMSGDRLLPKAVRHKSFGAALSVGLLGAMDKLDGWLARKAEAHGVEITKEDKEKDPVEDKKFNRWVMGSVAVREAVGGIVRKDVGRTLVASGYLLSLMQTEDRNERMERSRTQAVPGADTKAIWLNQWKTGMQNLGHTLAVSPIARSGLGLTLTTGIYATSNVMGEIGLGIADRIHRGETHSPALLVGSFEPIDVKPSDS